MYQEIFNECKKIFKEGMKVVDYYEDIGIVPHPSEWIIESYGSIHFCNKSDNSAIFLYTADNESFAHIIETPYKDFTVFF